MAFTTTINNTEYQIKNKETSALEAYKQRGEIPGDFLRAILRNDFVDVVCLADNENLRNLPTFAKYLWWEMPGSSWGSLEKMEKWCAHNGMAGIKE